MKVLCIGDPHIKVDNISETEEMIEKIKKVYLEKKPDLIVCMGDMLDRHSTVHVSCLMTAEKMVEELSQLAPFYFIIGNHDRPNNSTFLTNEHPFNALKKWPNVFIIDDVKETEHFLFVPYVPNSRFEEALERVCPLEELNKYKAIFCHQEFLGAKMGTIISKGGDSWHEKRPLTISGHIHEYDVLSSNVVYIGTPRQQTFSESLDKRISLFTFNEKGEADHERIDLGMKKKVTINITPEELHGFKVPTDKHVKLVIHGEEAIIKSIIKSSRISELKKAGVKVCFKTQHSSLPSTDQPTEKMMFKDRLYQRCNKNPLTIAWCNKLFPN